jgi:hypothetical protein
MAVDRSHAVHEQPSTEKRPSCGLFCFCAYPPPVVSLARAAAHKATGEPQRDRDNHETRL